MKGLQQFEETFCGSSFPTRSKTTEGEICVVKMRGAGNGGGALLSEFLVNRLGGRAGLLVPHVSVINIPAEFPWVFGTDEFHDLVQKSAGANLALEWIEGASAVPSERYRSLPDELVSQIVTIDTVFENVDRTAQSGNLLVDQQGRYWIIDHGSCRFITSNRYRPSNTLPVGHILSDRAAAFDLRWLAGITPAAVRGTMTEVPEIWLHEAGVSREEAVQRILARLKLP